VVTRLLSSNGYAVECAVRGEEAIGKYESAYTEGRPFDVVVMDLTVPGGMGGKEAMQKILAIDPKAKAIVFSGYSNDPVLANYREYGFSGVIEKPFSIDEFMRVLSRIMTESDGGASAE
jgi:CheY-like chemotaxis protein